MTETLLRNRDLASGNVDPNGMGTPLHLGCLSYTAWDSGTAPSAEVMDGTGAAVENAVGVSASATAGTITVVRDGIYEITLAIGGTTCTTDNGTSTVFAVQVNSAAQSVVQTVTVFPEHNSASTGSGGGKNTRFVSLVTGDVVRAVVTMAHAAKVVTVSSGTLSVRLVADAVVYSQL